MPLLVVPPAVVAKGKGRGKGKPDVLVVAKAKPRAKAVAGIAKAKPKAKAAVAAGAPDLQLGCSKCRWNPDGCGRCKNPSFTGFRWSP